MAGNQAWIEEIEGMVSSLSCSADQLNSGLGHDGASLLRELRVGLNQLVLGIADRGACPFRGAVTQRAARAAGGAARGGTAWRSAAAG